ncbi:MAG: 23S rRNA pseudouridine(1911/1915/1917) synthase RluD [Gammaproteobacteria bacterium]
MSGSEALPLQRLSGQISETLAGQRVDKALACLFPDFSRARLQQWIREGQVLVDGERPRPRDKVRGGETVVICAELQAETACQAEDIPLEIVHEDSALLVINKPAGLVVHPGAGNREGTLLNALLHHAPELAAVPRAGIVHRLDKDTSGLLVVARTLSAQHSLTAQIQTRSFQREYRAVVNGVMTAGGSITAPIGRHRVQRTRMAVRDDGREAVTHYRVLERFRAHTYVRVMLETGRTHQIRVHMAHIRSPLVGDPVYGGRLRLPPACPPRLESALRAFRRQALHAASLSIEHPDSSKHLAWEVPVPDDMVQLLAVLRSDAERGDGSS